MLGKALSTSTNKIQGCLGNRMDGWILCKIKKSVLFCIIKDNYIWLSFFIWYQSTVMISINAIISSIDLRSLPIPSVTFTDIRHSDCEFRAMDVRRISAILIANSGPRFHARDIRRTNNWNNCWESIFFLLKIRAVRKPNPNIFSLQNIYQNLTKTL